MPTQIKPNQHKIIIKYPFFYEVKKGHYIQRKYLTNAKTL